MCIGAFIQALNPSRLDKTNFLRWFDTFGKNFKIKYAYLIIIKPRGIYDHVGLWKKL